MIISESQKRLYEKLFLDLGNSIITYLDDDDVNEIMLNPDGQLWIDRTTTGMNYVCDMPKSQAFTILHSVY